MAQENWNDHRDAAAAQGAAERERRRQGVRGDHWSRWFSRSRLGRNVFYCRIEWLQGVLVAEGWPHAGFSMSEGMSYTFCP